jgi:outer membrane protein assembly factor BamB
VGGATRVLFLGSQDGHVYAFDAESGNAAWTPSSPLLGDRVQAGPSAILSAFGGAPYDYILVGTRNDAAPNAFYALSLADGTVVTGWPFTGGAFGNIGVISGQAAVDYENKRVYFASQAYGSFPDDNTVWCVSLVDGSAIWAKPHGNVSGGVTLRGNRLYVGPDGGGVLALETSGPSAGDAAWTFPTGGFPVKGFVMADRLLNNVYFSTSQDRVFSLFDTGPGYSENWTPGGVSLPSPSTPVYAPGHAYVYVGGVGQLFRLNVADGTIFDSYPLGDPTAVVGSPTIDLGGNFVYVGSEDGVVHAFQIP